MSKILQQHLILEKNKRLNRRSLFPAIFLFLILISFLLLLLTQWLIDSRQTDMDTVKIECFEDVEDGMQIFQLMDLPAEQFKPVKSNLFLRGYSASAWWLRLKLTDTAFERTGKYLTYDNEYCDYCILYEPVNVDGKISYQSIKAEYGYRDALSVSFCYPVFQLSDNLEEDQYLYIKLAPYVLKSGNINIYTDTQFRGFANRMLMINGFIFGCFIMLNVFCLFIFERIKFKFYIVSMIMCMLSVLAFVFASGIGNVIFYFSQDVVDNSVGHMLIGLLCHGISMFIFALFFILVMKSYYNTKENFKKINTLLNVLIVLNGIIFLLILLQIRFVWIYQYIERSYIAAVFVMFAAATYLVIKDQRFISFPIYFGLGMLEAFGLYKSMSSWGLIWPESSLHFLPQMFLLFSLYTISMVVVDIYKQERIKAAKTQERLAYSEDLLKNKQLEFLQAQIKPHFINNSINVITALCRIDINKAKTMIDDLSIYLRHSFDFSNRSDLITLAEELTYTNAYINIEKERFVDEFSVEYDIDQADDLLIPPFILQPLVENAIRHGLRKAKKMGELQIRIKKTEEGYEFSVIDNGCGMTEEEIDKLLNTGWEKGRGIGIANINQRLQDLYGTKLICKSKIGVGTKMSFTIPGAVK